MKWIKNTNWSIFIIALLVFFIWQSPFLGNIRYPFILLGTWFHEMGHGITALILGGKFNYLEIYSNGGGVAYTSYQTNKLFLPYNITRALVAFGGLIGPCIMGGIQIISATNQKFSKWILITLVLSIIISLIFWVKSTIGIIVLALISIALSIIIYLKKPRLINWTVLFLGLQSTLSTYLQLDYLFTSSFERNGKNNISDTQTIADSLFGNHWFWAVFVILVSIIIILWKSYSYYLRKSL